MSNTRATNESAPSARQLLRVLDDALDKVAEVKRARREPIAVVGIGCRMPGAEGPEAFWQLLHDAVDAIGEVPPDRWDLDACYDPDPETPGKMSTRCGGFLDQVDRFDAAFFGISPREAVSLDPQQRLLLETSYQALEHAGQAPDRLSGSAAGVFIGLCSSDYFQLLLGRDRSDIDAYLGTGNAHSTAAGRLSYLLGLQGPSIAVDTACSSSLVAVHLACQSLRTRECDLALAGGVNLMLTPELTINFSKARMLAADGRCKTFDDAADGFIRGEGCGIVVLKRLGEALAANDNILAVIRGSAVNQDGRTSGLTAPNGPSQQRVIERALKNAGLAPTDIDYVEAHGTGTALGDPIEMGALGEVFAADRPEAKPLLVGSVKTNIGHLEGAAGVAGLIKAVLALHHGEIPPHLHFQQPSQHIAWDGLPVRIPTERTAWPTKDGPRTAGVSSFGFSGTNSHIILEEAPRAQQDTRTIDRPCHLLALSARSQTALNQLAASYAEHLSTCPETNLADLCATAGAGRAHFNHRLAVPAESTEQLRPLLADVASGREVAGVFRSALRKKHGPRVGMVFTGQGSQYAGMARELYETQPTFRRTLERCDQIARPLLKQPLLDVIYPAKDAETPLGETAYTQPALFAIEYALAELWRSWGIEPHALLGHSLGEYVAACVAGVFSLEDGLRLVCERARLIQALPRDGAMIAVAADASKVESAIAPFAEDVALAAINGPNQVVVSGRREAIEQVGASLSAEGIHIKQLDVSHAFHSPLIEPVVSQFEQCCRRIDFAEPQLDVVSNLTGQIADSEIASADYWCRHLRQPVRFAQGIQALAEHGCGVILEIGPKPVLLGLGRQCLADAPIHWLPSLRPTRPDWPQLLESLAELYVLGADVDWQSFDRDYNRRKVVLPTYPFQRERFWVESTRLPRAARLSPERNGSTPRHPLLGARLAFAGSQVVFENEIASNRQAFLWDHCICQTPLLPASGYLEMALAAAEQVTPRGCLTVEDIELIEPLRLPDASRQSVQTLLSPQDDGAYAVQFFSRHESGHGEHAEQQQAPAWKLHATARLVADTPSAPARRINLAALRAECPEEVDVEQFYREYRRCSIEYGPRFQAVGRLWRGDNAAVGQIVVPKSVGEMPDDFLLHPVLLDACFQVLGGVLADTSEGFVYLPSRVARITLYDRAATELICHGQLHAGQRPGEPTLSADLRLISPEGKLVASVEGFEVARTNRDALRRLLQSNSDGITYELTWQRKTHEPSDTGPESPGRWLFFADDAGLADDAAEQLRVRGERCIVVRPGDAFEQTGPDGYRVAPREPEDFRRLLEAMREESEEPLHGVVYYWNLNTSDQDRPSPPGGEQQPGCLGALHLVQQLVRSPFDRSPPLWLVMRGSQAVGERDEACDTSQAPLWGMARVIALEHPELHCRRIDLDPAAEARNADHLVAELTVPDSEDQVAYRDGERFAARLAALPLDREHSSTSVEGATVRTDATYLITGGLGALGLKVAAWLAERGARHLVLNGRRGTSNQDAAAMVKQLEQSGVEVRVVPADVANPKAVQRIADTIAEEMPPLKGIVHAAGVLDDCALVQLDCARLRRVLAPKAIGAWNLHQLTQDLPLDFFVCFSSIASVLGSPGQGNYAAANAFLDALAHHRRARGLPALSVNWGPWGDGGMAAQAADDTLRRWETAGVDTLEPAEALDLLDRLLGTASAQAVVAKLDFARLQKYGVAPPLLEEVQPRGDAAGARFDALRKELAEASPSQREALLTGHMREQLAGVLRLRPEQVDPSQPLNNLGVDSLMAVELRNRIQTELGVEVPITAFLEGMGLADLASLVSARWQSPAAAPSPVAVGVEDDAPLDDEQTKWIEGEI